MKFSVVIPMYNGEKFIANTLDSVKSQTFKDFEVIVVNDGSTDRSIAVVDAYKKKGDLPIVLISQKNSGLGSARNLGILHARGEYIALLDQDDIWYPEKLNAVAGATADVIYHAQHVRRAGNILRTLRSKNYKDMSESLFWRNDLSGSTVCFKKKILEKVGGFAEDLLFVEDYDLWLRMADMGVEFFYLDTVLGERIIHGSNFSNQIRVMRKNEIKVIKKYLPSWKSVRLIRLGILHLKYLRQQICNYLTLT